MNICVCIYIYIVVEVTKWNLWSSYREVGELKMQGFQERGGGPPPDLAQLQSTMHAIELACTSIQVVYIVSTLSCSVWFTRKSMRNPTFPFAENE